MSPCREELFASSPLQSSQASSLGCCSLPNSQLDALQQEVLSEQQQQKRLLQVPKVLDEAVAAGAPEPVTPIKKDARTRVSVPPSKVRATPHWLKANLHWLSLCKLLWNIQGTF